MRCTNCHWSYETMRHADSGHAVDPCPSCGERTAKEPAVHLGPLPKHHFLAQETVECDACGDMVHAFNNEDMSGWVEFGEVNLCLPCFTKVLVDAAAKDYMHGYVDATFLWAWLENNVRGWSRLLVCDPMSFVIWKS